MRTPRLTRAELAAQTGISKSAVGESVRRLAAAGLVEDTGERTPGGRGRGRVGTYYALAAGTGGARAVSVEPECVVAESVDAYGVTRARAREDIAWSAAPDPVAAALRAAAARVTSGTHSRPALPTRAAVVSVAGPVDRASGRLVRLPDEPIRLGELDSAAVLRPLVAGPVLVDNDVNWAARAERDRAADGGSDDFAYLYLGEGLGAAIVSNGEVVRGYAGLAGEVAHIVTVGADGQATRFIDFFGDLGLRQPGSTAIDVPRLLAVAANPGGDTAVRHQIGQAISGVLAALTELADPRFVVVGGPWGNDPAIFAAVTAATARFRRQVGIHAATVTSEPSLAGARAEALRQLRTAIIASARNAAGASTAVSLCPDLGLPLASIQIVNLAGNRARQVNAKRPGQQRHADQDIGQLPAEGVVAVLARLLRPLELKRAQHLRVEFADLLAQLDRPGQGKVGLAAVSRDVDAVIGCQAPPLTFGPPREIAQAHVSRR
jgi:predicted NBD/HSP70 family sugar kinase